MKKYGFLFFVLMAVMVFAAWPAQAARGGGGGGGGGEAPTFGAGTMMLGGDFNFRLASGGTTIDPDGGDEIEIDNFYFDLTGLFGYFIINRLEIGPTLEFSYESSEQDDQGKNKETDWGIGAHVGYFYPVGSRISIFGMMVIGYAKNATEFDPDDEDANKQTTEASGFALEPRFGAMYGINRHLGLTGSLYYRYFSGSGNQDTGDADNDYDVKSSEYGLKLGLAAFF